MIQLVRTNSEDKMFQKLVNLLDAELAKRDGEDHEFYHQFNAISNIKHAVVLYKDNEAVGCGAIKHFDSESMEVKRMYTLPISRGHGIASQILTELEAWSKELGYTSCVLETGKKQPEAIHLYKKSGYHITRNYGQYKGIENSICFKKEL